MLININHHGKSLLRIHTKTPVFNFYTRSGNLITNATSRNGQSFNAFATFVLKSRFPTLFLLGRTGKSKVVSSFCVFFSARKYVLVHGLFKRPKTHNTPTMKAARRISTVFFKSKPKADGDNAGALPGVSENDDLRAGWETKKTIDGIN